jgi:hypothetical protein
LRSAALAVLMCLFVFTVAPIAHAETTDTITQTTDKVSETADKALPTEKLQEPQLQGEYFTKGGKHYVQVKLNPSKSPRGTWIITLNGSDEQASPENAQLNQFTAKYDDLVPGRNYQLIAVFYGKDGERAVDVNTCYNFTAKKPTQGMDNRVPLQDCGLVAKAKELKKQTLDTVNGDKSDGGKILNGGEKGTAPSGTEESGSFFHFNSGKQEGGPMPDTAAPSPAWMSLGAQMLLVGAALLGFRPSSRTEDE